jgi:hypothetical protein
VCLGDVGPIKKLRVVRVDSPDGEIHYVLQESPILERSENAKDVDEVKVKKITKKEASKPLLLTHE